MSKILVVDDIAVNRQFLSTLLRYAQNEIVEAVDGAQALQLVAEEKPDLIIADILMPTMDGYELVRKLQEDIAFKEIPVIFYTATYRETEAQALAHQCGVRYVLSKPSEPQMILNTVQAALGEKASNLTSVPSPVDIPDLGVVSDVMRKTLLESERIGARLAALVELGIVLAAQSDFDKYLQTFARGARSIISSRYSAVAVVENGRKNYRHFTIQGFDTERLSKVHRPSINEGLLEALLKETRPILINDLNAEPGLLGLPLETGLMHSFLGVPFKVKDGSGWICFTNKVGLNEFTMEDERFAITLANQFVVSYETKRSEEELESATRQLSYLFDTLDEVFFSQDITNRKLLYISPACKKLYGVSPQTFYKSPMYWKEAIHKNDLASVNQNQDLLAQGKSVVEGYRILRPDGEIRWVEAKIKPTLDGSGNLIRLDGLVSDITARKLDEATTHEHAKLSEFAAAIGLALTTAESLQNLLQNCTQIMVRYLNAALARVWTFNESDEVLELQASAGLYTHLNGPHSRIPMGQFKIGRIAQTRKAHLTNSVIGDPHVLDQEWAKRESLTAFAGYPLIVEDRLVGVMAIFARQILSERTLEGMGSVAHELALGIDRKQSEEALKQSERKFRELFEESLDAIYITSPAGKFLDANAATVALFGYSIFELLTKITAVDIYSTPEDRKEFTKRMAEVGFVKEFEFSVRRKDGENRSVSVTASAMHTRTGSIAAYRSIARDITVQRRNEARLAAQHAITGVLAESPNLKEASVQILRILCTIFHWEIGVVWQYDAKTSSLRWIGSHPAAIDSSSEIQHFLNEIRSGAYGELLQECLRRRERVWVPDFVNQHKDATQNFGHQGALAFPVGIENEVNAVFEFVDKEVREPDPEILGILSAISSQVNQYIVRKRAEEEKNEVVKQLIQSQKIEAIGQLAGGVAHDFNNILMAVNGYSELLLLKIPETSPFKKDVQEILTAAERGANLTRQLLAFSRRQVLAPKVLELKMSIAGMENMLQRLIGEDVDLQTILSAEQCLIEADPGQMEQVVMNLVVNSRDAMPAGGKITIEVQNTELDDEYARSHLGAIPGSYVLLSVSDTGEGMEEQTMQRMFEPFFTTKQEGKGTGLGLSTVYGIVKQSGGYIWVYSQKGIGSTFKIYLPRVHPEANVELVPQIMQPKDSSGTGKTILLADDNAGVRQALSAFLRIKGYEVLEAERGLEAVEIAKKHAGCINLLITDVVMPEMNGRELAKRLRERAPDLKILFMSGYTEEAVKRHGVLEERSAFVSKPVRMATLLMKIAQLMD